MRDEHGSDRHGVRLTMWWVPRVCVSRSWGMWVLVLLWTAACGDSAPPPSITFTKIPPADKGGPDVLDTIEGRITGVRPGERLVIYGRSSVWWVQPDPNSPYTEIRKDSTFSARTHLGTEYAALLVAPDYQPPATLETLPREGGSVVRLVVVPGDPKAKAVRHTLRFAGYEWTVRAAPSDRGGPNKFDPANAWTDVNGAVHLRIAGEPGHWTCAELTLTRSFGYGLYSFTVDDISMLDPAARFVIFTWDGPAVAQYGREMAITIGRHGERPKDNARYVIEPIDLPANRSNFFAPAGVLTHQLRWEPDRATFRTFRGARPASNARPVAQHTFTSGVPAAGNETIRFSLYVFQSSPTPMQKPAEVVVRRFTFEP
jgi:hypothetical protein